MAANGERVILIVMAQGHGDRTLGQILSEKRQDIRAFGRTYWYGRARSIDPLGMRGVGPIPVYIIEQASRGPADQSPFDTFTRWSLDNLTWQPFPDGLNRVTGSARGTGWWAMVFDQLEPRERSQLDLWDYSNQDASPIRFTHADYAAYAKRKPSQGGMRSHRRGLIAVARLCEPYFVYLGN